MELTIGTKAVNVNEEGFMTDLSQWDRDVAREIAARENIELTDRHWEVIRFMREDYKAQGTSPTLRRVSAVGGVPTKELFTLFPKKPAKKMAYIAGVPKPQGCV